MRCKKSERWISDRLDGTLAGAKARRLVAHLGECSACRSVLRRQERLQAAARGLAAPERSREYWENSISRLQAKLAAAPAPRPLRGRTRAFVTSPRWAWAEAVTTFAVAAGLFFLVLRGGAPIEFQTLAFEDAYGNLAEQIGDSADLESSLNASLQLTIGEHAAGVDGEVHHLLYGHSEFLDSLSDEEVQVLDAELSRVLKI
jgi:anti-sigma factor RsiW